MQTLSFARRALSFCLLAAFAAAVPAVAQTSTASLLRPVAQANRVAANASFTARTQLARQLPGWASVAAQSAKPVSLSDMVQVTVGLQRSTEAEAAFEQLLSDQQNASSPLFHHWLTGEQIGQLYGPTNDDIAAVEAWATSEGLTVDEVASTRVSVQLSGPVSKMASAFRTSFANFNVGGETVRSATTEPSIPTALSGVIGTIYGLADVRLQPTLHRRDETVPTTTTDAGTLRPMLNASNGDHLLTPTDFNIIYDISSVLSGGNTGAMVGSTPQHIAIIARSQVAPADLQNFASLVGTTYVAPNVVVAGTDPGVTGDGNQDEATLDVNRVQGTAPGAIVDLVVAASVKQNGVSVDGVYTATNYVVNTRNRSSLVDQVMTLSFGGCEASFGQSSTQSYNSLFQAAAAEGVAVFVSSGDSGANGCYGAGADAVNSTPSSNALCGAYVTCVGGTEFVEGTNSASYWSSTNAPTTRASALGYIPEGVWNEPVGTTSKNVTGYVMAAGGGAPSIYINRPSWQTGTGVPAGTMRLTPDVAFTSAGHDGYVSCLGYANRGCVATSSGIPLAVFSGTSAAAPSMAAIAALLNTAKGSAQGFLNPSLYALAQTPSYATAFHDTTVASSGVSGCSANTVSVCNNSTPSATTGLSVSSTQGVVGFTVNAGYDLATGLGSLDVAKYLTASTASAVTATTLTVAAAPTSIALGSASTLTATLTPTTAGTTAATGTVTFFANGTQVGTGSVSNNTATFSFTPPGAGLYYITASYGGDSNYGTSSTSGTSVSVVVNSGFSVSAASLALPTAGTLVSGSTVTDAITVTSIAPFAGTVNLTCVVTAASTSATDVAAAAGTKCALAPTGATVTSGSSSGSTLTLTTTPGTAGKVNIIVSGTSGAVTNGTNTIVMTLTGASFTIDTPTPTSLSLVGGATTGNTATVKVTSVNGFAGAVALTCSLTNPGGTSGGTATGSCAVTPSVTLTSGSSTTATVTVATTAGTSGLLNLVVTGTGTTAGASASTGTACGTSTQPCLTVTVGAALALAASPTSLSFTSGATSGNTSVITLTPAASVSGTAAVSCTITSSSATYQPTCVLSSTSVTLASGVAGTTTLSIGSHVATTQGKTGSAFAGFTGSRMAMLAVSLGALFAFRKRRGFASLAVLGLLLVGLTAVTGCGGDNAPKATQSSAGTYTATVTAVLNGSTVSTAVNVTIQ